MQMQLHAFYICFMIIFEEGLFGLRKHNGTNQRLINSERSINGCEIEFISDTLIARIKSFALILVISQVYIYSGLRDLEVRFHYSLCDALLEMALTPTRIFRSFFIFSETLFLPMRVSRLPLSSADCNTEYGLLFKYDPIAFLDPADAQ